MTPLYVVVAPKSMLTYEPNLTYNLNLNPNLVVDLRSSNLT